MNKFALAFADAKTHARACYPEESCGLIVGGKYIACTNVASDPDGHNEADKDCGCRLCAFEINPKVYAKFSKQVEMVVHSHPDGPFYPSKADMEGQVLTGKAWAIFALDDERVSNEPVVWGGDTPIPDIVGRSFMHGVTDCYAVIKDVYALGKDKLAEQGIPGWPYEPIELMHMPREDAWWEGDSDLYIENFAKAGFVETKEPKPGDVWLMKIRSPKFNHGGVLVGNDLIVHHLPQRLSRREPAGVWGRQAGMWLRYAGVPADA
ncbi:Mov34/MPN/PAD-1 family protein [Agrobacterium sp. CG674]